MPYERRHYVRVQFDAPAVLTLATAAFNVQVLDLSLKGALITLPENAQVPAGMPCQLDVPLAETEDCISMTAGMAHVDGNRAGLLCRSIDLDSVTHLRRLIELQLGDPALLERDLAELIQSSSAAE